MVRVLHRADTEDAEESKILICICDLILPYPLMWTSLEQQ